MRLRVPTTSQPFAETATRLNEETLKQEAGSPFDAALAAALARRGMSAREVCPPGDALARRVLEEYGAMFLAAETVRVPPRHRILVRARPPHGRGGRGPALPLAHRAGRRGARPRRARHLLQHRLHQ